MEVEIITLRIHTALPEFTRLLKSEEIILRKIELSADLQRITHPRAIFFLTTNSACEDIIGSSRSQTGENNTRRIQRHLLCRCQIGSERKRTQGRIDGIRYYHDLPERIRSIGRCQLQFGGVKRSSDEFQFRSITRGHIFQTDIIQIDIISVWCHILNTGCYNQIIIRQVIVTQEHFAMSKRRCSRQSKGIKKHKCRHIIHVRHHTYIHLS